MGRTAEAQRPAALTLAPSSLDDPTANATPRTAGADIPMTTEEAYAAVSSRRNVDNGGATLKTMLPKPFYTGQYKLNDQDGNGGSASTLMPTQEKFQRFLMRPMVYEQKYEFRNNKATGVEDLVRNNLQGGVNPKLVAIRNPTSYGIPMISDALQAQLAIQTSGRFQAKIAVPPGPPPACMVQSVPVHTLCIDQTLPRQVC